MKRSELVQGVISWNRRFPLDRWWRQKHNVPFMSSAHRESSFIHQLMEYEEDRMFFDSVDRKKGSESYIPGIGDLFKSPASMEDFKKEAQMEIEELLNMEENGRGQENKD